MNAEPRSTPLLTGLVALGALLIPLAVLPHAFDAYRLPKDLLLRGEAIVIVALVLGTMLLGAALLEGRSDRRLPWSADRLLLLPLAAFGWMIITTLTSTNQGVSFRSLATGAATLIVFAATVAVARVPRFLLVGIPLVAAVANGLLTIMEETGLWMPFGVDPTVPHHQQCTALVGNPNELGSYLAAAALACIAAAVTYEERRKLLGFSAALLVAALVASQTLTAMTAFFAAMLAMLALLSWRRALAGTLIAALLAAVVVMLVPPLRQRAKNIERWVRKGHYNALLTNRLTPFVAASMMTADHPLTGAGPGTFGWNYHPYKIRAEQRYPSLRKAYNREISFGEVHNDHLQVLAEGGVPGFVLFLAVLGALAGISLRKGRGTVTHEGRFALLLALPLAVLWLVLSIAQFPLETAVVRMLLAHFAALCVAWRPT